MNKVIQWIIGLVIVGTVVLNACTGIRGSGNMIVESRAVSNFDRVDLSGGDLTITQGEAESLTVETDDNLMRYVKTDVRNGTLYLDEDSRQLGFSSPTRLVFTLQVKDLTGLSLSGSGSVEAATIATDRLDIDVSGSGNINAGDLHSDVVDVRVSGSGETTVWAVETLDVNLSGSGDVRYYGEPRINSSKSGSGTVNSLGEK